MAKTVLLVTALCVTLLKFTSAQDSFYALNTNPYLNFSHQTAYEFVYNKSGIASIPYCKPVILWLVARHGTRLPGASEILGLKNLTQLRHSVISNFNANKSSLCLQDIENLKAWQFNLSVDQANLLTSQGRKDEYSLGQRLRSYFPQLLNMPYSAGKMVFRYTNTSRTKESAEYFVRGVLGLGFDSDIPPLPAPIKDDRLLQRYHKCPLWDSLTYTQEFKKFINSKYMTSVINNVSHRLGFNYSLSSDILIAMYNGCRYQKAWNITDVSPWCAAFSTEELVIMEYCQDLKHYYHTGPGYPLNGKLASCLVKDLFDRFSVMETQPGGEYPTSLMYFAHDTMLHMLSARLGLNDDSLPLTSDNFPHQQDRQFRSSFIAPFAGNTLAVLYNCSYGDPLKMMFYQGENIVQYPGCSAGLCDWNYIKQKLTSIMQDSACMDDSYCLDKSGVQLHTASMLAVVMVFLNLCHSH